MKNFSMMHALFIIVIPLGLLLAVTGDYIVQFFTSELGLTINKGDVVIVFIAVSVIAAKIGHQNDKKRKE